jgi:hypothetical protein
MKRHLIYYSNGLLEQVSEVNSTLEHQVDSGVISFIVDTQLGTVLGKTGNPQVPAQWFEIPAVQDPELKPEKDLEMKPEGTEKTNTGTQKK